MMASVLGLYFPFDVCMYFGNLKYKKTEVFGLEIPTEIEGVPSEILDPINTVSLLHFKSSILL